MGEALRLLRMFYGYKAVELAKKLGISQSYISELENGKRQPTMEVLDKYAKVFKMKKSTLMLFAEALESNDNDMKREERVAYAAMRYLRLMEKVGKLEDE